METPNADKYFTVGEAAKKMGVSVRTLQYYHKIGLLPPSGISEGGRRQYTYRDLVQLHQILSLKHLGFSLQDIKERLPSLDTPEQVAQALEQQAQDTRSKIQELTATLQELEALRTEVLQMQSVDFKKYADIIVNLQMHNDYYWLIKHFDSQTMDYIRRRFDSDSGTAMIQTFTRLQEQALQLQRQGFPPDSPPRAGTGRILLEHDSGLYRRKHGDAAQAGRIGKFFQRRPRLAGETAAGQCLSGACAGALS